MCWTRHASLSLVSACRQDLIAAEDRSHVFVRDIGIGTTARSRRLCGPSMPQRNDESGNWTPGWYQSRRFSPFQYVTTVMLTRTNVGLQEFSIGPSIRPLGRNGSAAAARSAVATATAERNGITSFGNVEWGPQLSLEAHEPRGGNHRYSRRNPCGMEGLNRTHKATICDENCTLPRLLRKQIMESRETVVTC